jgi:hypothetical protein
MASTAGACLALLTSPLQAQISSPDYKLCGNAPTSPIAQTPSDLPPRGTPTTSAFLVSGKPLLLLATSPYSGIALRTISVRD